ncbi:MAG: NAD(P)-binding domain-containing protein [Pyrinomonadaceae bacterium]|nr:NAD(P)-binding domain-containing protein [Pyrinomonadaceae bacterium]
MKKSQLYITVLLLALLMAINLLSAERPAGGGHSGDLAEELLTGAYSLRSYLGGLPWYGWAGIAVFLATAGIAFALRDARRARRMLEEPVEKHVEPDTERKRLSKTLMEKYGGPDYAHPIIITDNCIACQRCVDACPHGVLTMAGNFAEVSAPDQCMEDTACEQACPVNPKACVVVNATKEIKPRPVPRRDQKNFMTEEVPGCYLVGDASGVPLIKNAANEGADVIKHIKEELENSQPEPKADYDVAIVGIGVAGLSAAITAKQQNLRYIGIEQDVVLATIASYPKDKPLFFKPESMPVRGAIPIIGAGGISGEILESWLDMMHSNQVVINERESCKGVKRAGDGGDYFIVETQKRGQQETITYRVRRVVLALGERGTPKKIGADNEGIQITRNGRTEKKVRYVLSNPEEFKGQKMIVVGGGNSAVEAAVALVARVRSTQIESGPPVEFRPPGDINEVTLVVRSNFTNDIKLENKLRLYHCVDEGRVEIYFDTSVKEIRENEVVLMDTRTEKEKAVIANDYVLALVGGGGPGAFLESVGITIPKN